jgi:hypothetical protein
MNDDRLMVAQAVLEGKLPAESLTLEEVYELQERVFDVIASKVTSLPQNINYLQ